MNPPRAPSARAPGPRACAARPLPRSLWVPRPGDGQARRTPRAPVRPRAPCLVRRLSVRGASAPREAAPDPELAAASAPAARRPSRGAAASPAHAGRRLPLLCQPHPRGTRRPSASQPRGAARAAGPEAPPGGPPPTPTPPRTSRPAPGPPSRGPRRDTPPDGGVRLAAHEAGRRRCLRLPPSAPGGCTGGETEAREGLLRSRGGRVRRHEGTPCAAEPRRASGPGHGKGLKSRRWWAPGWGRVGVPAGAQAALARPPSPTRATRLSPVCTMSWPRHQPRRCALEFRGSRGAGRVEKDLVPGTPGYNRRRKGTLVEKTHQQVAEVPARQAGCRDGRRATRSGTGTHCQLWTTRPRLARAAVEPCPLPRCDGERD